MGWIHDDVQERLLSEIEQIVPPDADYGQVADAVEIMRPIANEWIERHRTEFCMACQHTAVELRMQKPGRKNRLERQRRKQAQYDDCLIETIRRRIRDDP